LGRRAKAWETYEQAAAHMLEQLSQRVGIKEVQGKRQIRGLVTGTDWEIDAQATRVSDGALVLIECRRKTTSRLNQEALAAIAYRIRDSGAGGAITVSPFPLQKGADLVAKAEGIQHVILHPDSTPDSWAAELAGVLQLGFTDRVSASISETLHIVVRNEKTGEVVEERYI
jgi:hypothetical protein